jgi:hypothetical protein
MRSDRKSARLTLMSQPEEKVRLVIELHGSADPIEGELIEPADQATRFSGWLSLAALIETCRSTDASSPMPGQPG